MQLKALLGSRDLPPPYHVHAPTKSGREWHIVTIRHVKTGIVCNDSDLAYALIKLMNQDYHMHYLDRPRTLELQSGYFMPYDGEGGV